MALSPSCRILGAALLAASALRRGVKKQDCFSDYDGKPLLEFVASSPDELSSLSTKLDEMGCVDVGDDKGTQVLAICSTEQTADLQNSYGDRIKVVVEDAGEHYRTSSGPAHEFTKGSDGPGAAAVSTTFYRDWRNVEARIAQVEAAVANSGGVATLYQIGSSVEGRPIMAVRLRGAGWTSGGPRVVANCGLHAREWITGMSCVYVVEAAIDKARAEPSWLAGTEFTIVPMSNPDGSLYSETSSRMWRKNRAVNPGSSCIGVDLNRNWDPDWRGYYGTSTSKCSDVYVGPSAFSEPETQAVKGLIDESPVTIHLDIHSYGSVILRPWSHTNNPHPRLADIDVPGQMMRDAIRATNGRSWPYGGNELLSPASGVCPDYSTSQGAFGYTWELPPSSSWAGGFAPPASEILPTAQECFEGILAAITYSQNPPAPTPAPPAGTWELSGSGCVMDGSCVQSLNYPSNYGNDEQCTVSLYGSIPLRFESFSTERGYDTLNVGGSSYSGTSGPSSGSYTGTISWASDYTVTRSGWKFCRTDA